MFDAKALSQWDEQIKKLQERLDNLRKQEELVLKELRPLIYKAENYGRR